MTGRAEYDSEDDSSDTTKRVIATSPNGKSDIVCKLDKTGYYRVKYLQGGDLPQALQGKWTSYEQAERSVHQYLNSVFVDAGGKTRKVKTK